MKNLALVLTFGLLSASTSFAQSWGSKGNTQPVTVTLQGQDKDKVIRSYQMVGAGSESLVLSFTSKGVQYVVRASSQGELALCVAPQLARTAPDFKSEPNTVYAKKCTYMGVIDLGESLVDRLLKKDFVLTMTIDPSRYTQVGPKNFFYSGFVISELDYSSPKPDVRPLHVTK